jgi:hypothetical protein
MGLKMGDLAIQKKCHFKRANDDKTWAGMGMHSSPGDQNHDSIVGVLKGQSFTPDSLVKNPTTQLDAEKTAGFSISVILSHWSIRWSFLIAFCHA